MKWYAMGIGAALASLCLAMFLSTEPAQAAPPERLEATSTMSVSISGPAYLGNAQTCNYYVTIQGGTAPYTITWATQNMYGSPISNSYAWHGGVSGYWQTGSLQASVTDASGQRASGLKYVQAGWESAEWCDG
jgi:hypothetical protein